MPRWEAMKASGVDWFMMRWLASRNILSAFCLLTVAVRLLLLILN